jgi:hypothetical protein
MRATKVGSQKDTSLPQAPAPKAPAATPTVRTTPGPPDPGAEPVNPFRKKRRQDKKRREPCRDRARARRRNSSSSKEKRGFHKAMVRNLAAVTLSQLKRDQNTEAKKKSMLSRLSPKGGSLFKLLSAKNSALEELDANKMFNSSCRLTTGGRNLLSRRRDVTRVIKSTKSSSAQEM